MEELNQLVEEADKYVLLNADRKFVICKSKDPNEQMFSTSDIDKATIFSSNEASIFTLKYTSSFLVLKVAETRIVSIIF